MRFTPFFFVRVFQIYVVLVLKSVNSINVC